MLRLATLLRERLRHICFPVSFAKFLGTLFSGAPPYGVGVAEVPAIGCGVSGTGSGFRVGWRAAGRAESLFFGAFLLVLAKLLFWRGSCALGYHSMEFRHFPNIC